MYYFCLTIKKVFNCFQALGKADHVVHEPDKPALSEVTCIPSTPLLENDQDLLPQTNNTLEENTHIPLHFTTYAEASEEQEPEEEESEELWEKDETESFSGYDCKKILVDMGSGDVVGGYGPR